VAAKPPEPTEPLAVVVGRNCKRIRLAAGVTQDELARCARDLGLRWNASKVGDFEAGRSAPTFASVLTVSLALEHAAQEAAEARAEISERQVTLADLVASDGWVALTDELRLRAEDVADVCRGKAWTFSRNEYRRQLHRQMKAARADILRALGMPEEELRKDREGYAEALLLRRSGLTEHRLAHRLGISHDRLADMSFLLWQRTFSEERDRRAGPDANKQKRGQISRTLQVELEKALADGDD
jgi:transcriptional regulator with XRE-family HTH domain